jgi:hypothetical protein
MLDDEALDGRREAELQESRQPGEKSRAGSQLVEPGIGRPHGAFVNPSTRVSHGPCSNRGTSI